MKKIYNMLNNRKGFTLIELIVVIAIIAILAAVAIPKLTGFQDSAKKKADIATGKTIATTVATLIADEKIPATLTNDITLTTSTTALAPTALVADTTDGSAIAAQYIRSFLQSVPKTKSGGTNFIIDVTNGTITVYADSTAAANELYPTPGTNY